MTGGGIDKSPIMCYACRMVEQTTRQMQPGGVLSGRDAANEIGVHFTTLYRWVQKGEIAYIDFGGSIFIPVIEAQRVKRERKKKATGEVTSVA